MITTTVYALYRTGEPYPVALVMDKDAARYMQRFLRYDEIREVQINHAKLFQLPDLKREVGEEARR